MSEAASPVQAYKIVTCFLPAGEGKGVLDDLRRQMGLHSAFVHHARGVGVESNRAAGGKNFFVEREIVTILVPAAQADEIFEFVYYSARLDRPHAGMVLMEKAMYGVPCILPPDVPDEA